MLNSQPCWYAQGKIRISIDIIGGTIVSMVSARAQLSPRVNRKVSAETSKRLVSLCVGTANNWCCYVMRKLYMGFLCGGLFSARHTNRLAIETTKRRL